MKKVRYMVVWLTAAILVTTVGCGKDDNGAGTGPAVSDSTLKSDLDQSIEAIRAKVQDMDLEPLRKTAIKYRDALKEKQDELNQVMEKLKTFSITEQMSEEAKGVRAELEQLTSAIGALQERFAVYVEAVAKKGGPVDDLSADLSTLRTVQPRINGPSQRETP